MLTPRAKAFFDAIGLRRPLVEMHNWILRPDWWRRERQANHFFRQLVRPRELVFDIGAHKGGFTERMRRLGARVVAVEPQPACHQILMKRFAGDPEVTIVPMAVGAAPGCAPMAVAHGSQVSSLVLHWRDRFPKEPWDEQTISVALTTLDNLVAEYGQPSFCKVDVEGYELEVLQGLHSPIALVSIEFTRGFLERTHQCLHRLAKLGYRWINYAPHLAYRFALPEHVTLEGALELTARLEAEGCAGGDLYAF